jgi:hypothetical protein
MNRSKIAVSATANPSTDISYNRVRRRAVPSVAQRSNGLRSARGES